MAATDSRLSVKLAYYGLDEPASRRHLAEAWRLIETEMPATIAAFYGHIGNFPFLGGKVGDELDRLQAAQLCHWKALFSGAYDETYLASFRMVGLVHVRAGIEPGWYIAG